VNSQIFQDSASESANVENQCTLDAVTVKNQVSCFIGDTLCLSVLLSCIACKHGKYGENH